MKKKEVKKDILEEKLLKGLDLAYERMIAEKRKNKQKIVVWKDGKIVTITPQKFANLLIKKLTYITNEL